MLPTQDSVLIESTLQTLGPTLYLKQLPMPSPEEHLGVVLINTSKHRVCNLQATAHRTICPHKTPMHFICTGSGASGLFAWAFLLLLLQREHSKMP